MSKTIDVAELQKDIEHVVEEVATTKIPYVLTRNDRPSAVMISYEDYIKLLSREEVITRFNESWAKIGARNAQYSEEEVAVDLELATQELRAKRARELVQQAKAEAAAATANGMTADEAWGQYKGAAEKLRKAGKTRHET